MLEERKELTSEELKENLSKLKMPKRLIGLHTHGPQSLNDSANTYDAMIKRAKEIGMDTISLTDHGTMMGIFPFRQKMFDAGLTPILGVEAYLQEDDPNSKKEHLILYARNNDGFRAISKAVTKSNNRIDSKGAPRMNMEILRKEFAEGAIGHGNVVATTACMQGPVNSVLLSPFSVNEKIEKLETKKAKYLSPAEDTEYPDICEKLETIETELNSLKEKKKEADKLSKKSFAKKEKTLKAAEGTEKYEKLKKDFDAEKAESEQATKDKKVYESEIAKLNKKKTELKARKKDFESSFDKWIAIDDEQQELEKLIGSDSETFEAAKNRMLELQEIFGKGYFFAEVQYHGIEKEAYCMPKLAKIAKELDIPLVAANDAHLPTPTPENRLKRQILRSLRFNKWEEEYDGDDQLYLKTNEDLAEWLLKILPVDYVQEALDNTVKVAEMCNEDIKSESHYPKFKSEIVGETAEGAIRRIATENIKWRFPNPADFTKEYQDRLEYELGIICDMGYADYHLIVQDFLNIGRKMGHMPEERFNYMAQNIEKMSLKELVDYINEDQSEVGLFIGPGRGSAVGSLVCYLLGITSIDPLKYGLLFERFLNPERISMPDIDSDFASECRGLVIEYVKKKYGNYAVCCITTKGTQAAKGAIRNCARLLGSELYNDTKTFLSLGDQIAKEVPGKPGTSFKNIVKFEYNGHTFTDIDDLNLANGTNFSVKELPEEVKYETLGQQLKEKFSSNANAIKIIDNAILVEGTSTHYGMHAAGVIISDNNDISDYVPLMWDDKNAVWKSQCDMVEAEENGLLKMDFLGLEQLSIITKALRIIKKRTGKAIDIERVAIEAGVLKDIYQTGLTNSIFQFESGGMKQMLRQFKPDTIDDVILLNAAYRPGPMQYLPKIIAIKQGKETQDYLVPELEPILKNTYGSIIYQEQVMRICQDLAGFTLGGADMVRRYMSKKKADKLEHEREAFINGDSERNIKGCVGNGISEESANELFDQMMDFAAYAFNKSHACAYSFVSYYTAWLKDHYPTEYLCADMDSIILDKIPGRIEDCKKFEINVLPPNINKSMEGFSIDGDNILFGLGSIKNVGSSAAAIIREREEHGVFNSFKDFLRRGHVKKDSTESLIKAGALDCFCDNRLAMLKVMPTLLESIKKIKDKTKAIEEKKAALAELEATTKNKETKEYAKKVASLNKSIDTATKAIETANIAFESVIVPSIPEDKKERLTAEKELIGVYVSSHPLDEYDSPEKLGATPIADLTPAKEVKIFGIIKNVRKTVRKKDGAPMAFFQLEDKTETVDVNCFTKAFAEYGIFVEEDAVVMITGACNEEEAFNSDEGEKINKVSVQTIEVVKPTRPSILIHCEDVAEWTEEMYSKIEPYKVSDGYTLIVHFRNTNTMQKAKFAVSHDFLSNGDIRTSLM